MAKPDVCMEIDPSKFLLVVGPNFTTCVIKELADSYNLSLKSQGRADLLNGHAARTPDFALKRIVDEGIRVLLDSEDYANEVERSKCELLYRNAYELDPQFALKKVTVGLQKTGRYVEWLRRAFEFELESHLLSSQSVSLHRVLELQNQGARLVYVHCDDILSRVTGTSPILLEDPEGLEQWLRGEKQGFLHVNGIYWEPDTVKLDGQFYENSSHYTSGQTSKRLKLLFQEKHTIVLGCESHPSDPLLSQFLKEYVSEDEQLHRQPHTFHLPITSLPLSKAALGLPIVATVTAATTAVVSEQEEVLSSHRSVHTLLCPITESSVSLWRQIEFPSYEVKDNQVLGLLVPGKQGAIEISKMMYNTPGVNFALVSSAMYKGHFLNVVCIRVDSSKMRDLWVWLFEEEKELLLGKGLLAVVMQSGTFVWLRGKPASPSGTREFSKAFNDLSQSEEMSEAMDTDSAPMPPRPHPQSTARRSKSSTVVPQIKEEYVPPGSSSPQVKAANKKVPRYTVTKFRVKQGGNSVTINGIPTTILKTAKHPHISIDDSSLLGPPGFSKNLYGRRCSLPHNMKPAMAFTDDQKAEATLNQLAEHMYSTPPHLEPPSYAAIKQALLCDQYKRRQSMQTDPKTLKNLLQTKLVISDRNDIVSLRRKSDPGSYLKQRDFERRKELFMDENRSWSQTYGKVIERKIVKWERKRQERFQREMLMRQFGGGLTSEHGQLKFQFLNPLAPQGLINPLTANGIQGGATSTLLAPSYLAANQNAAATAAGLGANPFIFSQPILAPSTTTAASAAGLSTTGTPSMFYSPFLTPYTFVNPYAPALQVTNALGQPTAATYYIPQQQQQPQQGSPQKVLYFVPTTGATGTGLAPAGAATTLPSTTSGLASSLSSSTSPLLSTSPSSSIAVHPPTNPVSVSILTSSSPENGMSTTSGSVPSPQAPQPPSTGGSVSLSNFPQLSSLMAPSSRTGHRSSLHSISSSSSSLSKDMSDETDGYEYRPVSPGSRKRHQSVPEKLSSLLQPSVMRGHLSPSHDEEDEEPVTPPSVKKQRSTSDTTVHYPPYGSRFSQLSPPSVGGAGGGSSLYLGKSKSTSPQPPSDHHRQGQLTALQSHLLKVHQIQQHQQNNSGNGGSGGGVNGRNVSMERQRRIGVHSPNALSGGGSVNYSNYIIRENSPSEMDEREVEEIVGGAIQSSGQQHDNQGQHSQLQLWRFLLELLLISANTHLIQWTEGEFEFQIKSPTEVAQLWGQVTNNPGMNHEKLALGLRYYFTKGIMSKVPGKRLTFKYAGNVRNYVQTRRSQMVSSHEEIVVVE